MDRRLLVAQCRCGKRIINITTGLNAIDMRCAQVGAPTWNHAPEDSAQEILDTSEWRDDHPVKKASNEQGVITVAFGYCCADGERAEPIAGTEMWITELYPLKERLRRAKWRYVGYPIAITRIKIREWRTPDERPLCFDAGHEPTRMEHGIKNENEEWIGAWICPDCNVSIPRK